MSGALFIGGPFHGQKRALFPYNGVDLPTYVRAPVRHPLPLRLEPVEPTARFEVVEYKRRTIHHKDGDVDWYALTDLSDVEAIAQLVLLASKAPPGLEGGA